MKRVRFMSVIIGVLSALPLAISHAADWPQYRGPNQDGRSMEPVVVQWPASGPKVVWKIPSNTGFSSFAVVNGKAYVQVVRDIDGAPREVCQALDAATGKELWIADVAAGKYDGSGNTGAKDNKGGDGPRSTPTVNDGMVYVLTPDIVLYGLDANTGKQIWKRDIMSDHAGRNIQWKSAASPVVDGDLVFAGGGGPGQSMLAFNKKTGAVVWKTGDEIITHATPVVATILGVRQVIFFMKSGLVSVAAKDGKLLWKFPYKFNVSTAASAVVAGDVVYCSAGYGVGGGACRIVREGTGLAAKELWQIPGDSEVANHWSTPIYKDGHLYGMFSFKKWGTGPLKCVELATGKVKWEQPDFGAGHVTMVGDRILALTDYGDLVVVAAQPQAYKELARAKVLDGKCWTTPAFANGRIYVRSIKEAVCLDASGR